MEAEFKLDGDLIVGSDLDLSKINTEDRGSIAGWDLNLTEEQTKELSEASKYGTRCKYDASHCSDFLKKSMQEYIRRHM